MSAMTLVGESAIRALAIAIAVGAVLALLRVRAERVRDRAWVSVLAAMVLMPLLIVVMPPLPAPAAVMSPRPAVGWLPERDAAGVAVAQPAPAIDLTVAAAVPPPSMPQSVSVAAPVITRQQTSITRGLFAAIAYLAIAAIFLFRLVAGWLVARRLVRSGRHLFGRVYESGSIASPMTTGIFKRRVVLPIVWRQWNETTMNAVLAHELAHVARRDVCVAAIAGINRSVFWFHPLAWWLEQRLAVGAEHAADDAAIARAGGGRAYAEILLGVADTVRRQGSRVAWHGVGMAGHASLADRIDRALASSAPQRLSRARTVLVAAGCAAAIVVGAACQRAIAPAPPLRPDPEVTAQIEARRAYIAQIRQAWALTPAELDAAQARWAANRSDEALARTLLFAYEPVHDGKWVDEARARVPARREIILWFIRNRPDSALARSSVLTPRPGNALPDPEGYSQARALWLAHLGNANLPIRALSNAAAFFSTNDPERGEQILLRARAIDPKGGAWSEGARYYSSSFSVELGRLYGEAVSGVQRDPQGRPSVSRGRLDAPFAARARKALEESQDAATLAAAAQTLAAFRAPDIAATLGFDPQALAQSYLERAVQLDPSQGGAKQLLHSLGNRHVFASARQLDTVAEFDAFVDEVNRPGTVERIGGAIAEAYMVGEMREHSRKPETARESWQRTRLFAERALARAPEFKDDAANNVVVATAHHALGLIALRDGDGAKAAQELALAGDAAKVPDASMFRRSLETRLTSTLLSCGVYEPVAAYFDKLASFGIDRAESEAAAAAIRTGRMPRYYQRLLASYEDIAAWEKLRAASR